MLSLIQVSEQVEQVVLLSYKKGQINNMIIKCETKHEERLKNFLKRDVIFNTFILADIDYYGFDKIYQEIYMDIDEDDKCRFVYLKFYNNLILSGKVELLDMDWVNNFIDQDISVVMGKDDVVKAVKEKSKKAFKYNAKHMYKMNDKKMLLQPDENIRIATLDDVDRIHKLLGEMGEFGSMYASKDMIFNRIKNNEGNHVYIERNGDIVAHGNSAATSDYFTMIGGVATIPELRNRQLATKIVSYLSTLIVASNRCPCLFSDKKEEEAFMKKIGFIEVGKWGTLESN